MTNRLLAAGLVAVLMAAMTPSGALANDFSTVASGSWRFTSSLGHSFGVYAGMPALVLEQANIPFAFRALTDEEDEEEDFLARTTPYVIVAAGLAGSAYLASTLFDDPSGSNPTTQPGGPGSLDPLVPGAPLPQGDPGGTFPPETTVPEPITLTLMATGLAGIGGARLRRRQRPEA